MNKLLQRILFCLLFCCSAVSASAQEAVEVVFMPQWTPQSQFAGYYIAYQKGYYAKAGIDLKFKHVSVYSALTPFQALMDGKVDIISQQLLQCIIYRSQGAKIVNILQTSQNSGLMCVSHTKIDTPKDLNGLKIGRWRTGYSEVCDMLIKDYNLTIEWIPFLQSIDLFIAGATEATLCYSYNEYFRLLFALGEVSEKNTMRFSDIGYNFPEDGIYVTEEYYNKNKDLLERFKQATIQGWIYAREHPEEALSISQQYIDKENIKTNNYHQRLMFGETLNLQVNPQSGQADFASITKERFDEIVSKLVEDSVISETVNYEDLIK